MRNHAAKLCFALLCLFGCGSDTPPNQNVCNMQNGQGCVCQGNTPGAGGCPGGATCILAPAGKPFCSHTCTDATAATDCAFGGPGTGACIWLVPDPNNASAQLRSCGIRCGANRACPTGFVAMDLLQDGNPCACVPPN